MGWGGATRDAALNKSTPPKADKLAEISMITSASITWLLTGDGAPYVVSWCTTGRDMADRIAAATAIERAAWSYELHQVGGAACVVLQRMLRGGQGWEYRRCIVLAGMFTPRHELEGPLTWLQPYVHTPDPLSELEFALLVSGWLSPHARYEGLPDPEPAIEGKWLGIAESAGIPLPVSPLARRQVLAAIDKLSDTDLQLVLQIVQRLAG